MTDERIKSHEISDDELDAAGGGDTCAGFTVVTPERKCFTGKYSEGAVAFLAVLQYSQFHRTQADLSAVGDGCCGNCVHLNYLGGTLICGESHS